MSDIRPTYIAESRILGCLLGKPSVMRWACPLNCGLNVESLTILAGLNAFFPDRKRILLPANFAPPSSRMTPISASR